MAGLPEHEQDFWLRKAEGASWSRNRLRQEVRASLAERATMGDPATRADPGGGQDGESTQIDEDADSSFPETGRSFQAVAAGARIQIELSSEQLESCQAAADRLGRSVEEWAAFALARAARGEVGHKNR